MRLEEEVPLMPRPLTELLAARFSIDGRREDAREEATETRGDEMADDIVLGR